MAKFLKNTNNCDKPINVTFLQKDMNDLCKTTKRNILLQSTYHLNPEIIQRERDAALRTQLNSKDGNTAEIHDQFYRDHKLLLKLFQFFGVMPVVRSSPGVVTFNWNSPAMIYAFLFYILTTSIVLKVGYERIQILQTTTEFDEYIYAIIFVFFLVPHFYTPIGGWAIANQVANYKTSWGTFQVRFYRVTGTSLTFPKLRILIVVLFIACVLCAILFLISLSLLLDGFLLWHTLAYFHIITMINMNCALWYINTRAIKRASTLLSICFKKDVHIECKSQIIHKYRLLWLNLSDLLQSLGNVYARTYSMYSLFMFVNITTAIYGLISEIFEYGVSLKVLGLFVAALYCGFLFFIICNCSYKATQVVAKGVQQTLLSINLLNVDIQTQREIDYFILTMELNPAVVSLRGYANVNRELLTSSLATMTVYLIVLLQFKLTIIGQKNNILKQ